MKFEVDSFALVRVSSGAWHVLDIAFGRGLKVARRDHLHMVKALNSFYI